MTRKPAARETMPSMAAHIGSFEIGRETGSALCQIAPRECFEERYCYRFASATKNHLVDVINRYLFNCQ